MTEIEKKACEEYPNCEGPCDKPNMFTGDGRINKMLREAYIKGAKEFCSKIWAQIKVYEIKDCVGHYDNETISMATYSNNLYQLSNFAWDLYHETTENNS